MSGNVEIGSATQILALLQSLTSGSDPYLWGFHWGRPFDGEGGSITWLTFEDDLLRMHFQNGRDEALLSVWSPRKVTVSEVSKELQASSLSIGEAQRVRWHSAYDGVPQRYIEFFRLDGSLYGKSNAEWPANTGNGLGDSSLPALQLHVFRGPPVVLSPVSPPGSAKL